MNNFLVREALGYSEFVGALLLLYEDKQGFVSMTKTLISQRNFLRENGKIGGMTLMNLMEKIQPLALRLHLHERRDLRRLLHLRSGDGTGMSPTRHGPKAPSFRSGGVTGSTSPPPGFETGDISEFSLADSFVLGVLRGFRLLQAAGLTADEKRDILASTKGSLEFEVVTQALQTLWDEQFLGRQLTSLRSSMGNYFNETFLANEENYERGWWDEDFYDGYWADESWDSSWDSWHEAQHGQADSPHQEEEPPEDPALQDSSS